MIGFFGDSYIDIADAVGKSYPLMLKDSLGCEAGFYARSGSSHWYAYEQFINHYNKFDTIVFCHTSESRWPHLPEEEVGHHFNIGYDWLNQGSFMKNINKFYTDIFSTSLLQFICKNIYDNVNRICKENNIYLINIVPFPLTYDYTNTDFPIIEGLDKISWREEIEYNGKLMLYNDWLSRQKMYDVRYCHLNSKNNVRLHDMIKNLIDNKIMNKHIIATNCEWDFRDIEFESSIDSELIERQQYLRKPE